MTRIGLVAVLMVVGLCAGQAMATATIYLSTDALNGTVPVPGNASITVNQGASATLYLWASLASANSTAMGIDLVPTNPAIIEPTALTVANPVVQFDPDFPDDTASWIYRWNDANSEIVEPAGFAAVGGFIDPQGVTAVGLTTTNSVSDPTRRGAAAPFQFYLGSFTFDATTVGTTDIFLTINKTLMLGNAGMIGDPASPVLHLGTGDAAVPVSLDGTTKYVAEGVTGSLADATITVVPVPEPATLGLLALGGLALVRRR